METSRHIGATAGHSPPPHRRPARISPYSSPPSSQDQPPTTTQANVNTHTLQWTLILSVASHSKYRRQKVCYLPPLGSSLALPEFCYRPPNYSVSHTALRINDICMASPTHHYPATTRHPTARPCMHINKWRDTYTGPNACRRSCVSSRSICYRVGNSPISQAIVGRTTGYCHQDRSLCGDAAPKP